MNFKMIKNVLGWILIFEAMFLAVPLVTAIVYKEALLPFLGTILICLAAGFALTIGKTEKKTLYSKDGFVIVALSWIVLSLFGALPFIFSGAIPSFIDALFETVSGFTTTGASILSDVESLPKSVLMWRSFTHWVGGMGVLVFIMAFVPLSGGRNVHIMKAESPGPSVSKLVPHVKATVTILYVMYFALTLIEFVVLLIGGMNVFDAINTAVATAGTGGFGIKNDSFTSFSPFLQNTVTVFMLLFSVNFTCYYLILKGKIKDAFNTETIVFILMVTLSTAAISINVASQYSSTGETVRHVAFSVATVVSTTGFSTTDFDLWPSFSKAILVSLMFIGACAGSTGGGTKISRIIIAFKGMQAEIKRLIHPRQVMKTSLDGHSIEEETVHSVYAYYMCFLAIFAASFLILLISERDIDLVSSFTAVTATMNNIGPGLVRVGPTQNFGFFSVTSKIVFIFDMLAGRLELFPMIVLLSPRTWKK